MPEAPPPPSSARLRALSVPVGRRRVVALVALLAGAPALVAQQTNEALSRTEPSLLSNGAGGTASGRRVMSDDGRFTVFVSSNDFVVPGQVDGNANNDIFLYDALTDSIVLVSHANGSTQTTANGLSSAPSISADGGFVVYESRATNLVLGGDSNGGEDVFRWDRLANTNLLISDTPAAGVQAGNGLSSGARLSADGSVVVFGTAATNFGATDTNGAGDVYRWSAGVLTLVSHTAASATTTASGASSGPVLSFDGSLVAFTSAATDLVPGATDTNGTFDIFLWDAGSPSLTLVSDVDPSAAAVAANGLSFTYDLAGDGSRVVFLSSATNFVPSDLNGATDVLLFTRATGAVTPVSHAAADPTSTANGGAALPSISPDGRFVVFESAATNLVVGFVNGNGTGTDVYRHDTLADASQLVSHSTAGTLNGGNGASQGATISALGTVAFTSTAGDLVTGFSDQNSTGSDAFLWSPTVTTLMSHDGGGAAIGSNQSATARAFGLSGSHVLFETSATNVVAGDPFPTTSDVYRHEVTGGQNGQVSRRVPSQTGRGASALRLAGVPVTSSDGRFTVFESQAFDLVPGQVDVSGVYDVFLHDRQDGSLTLVSHSTAGLKIAGNGASRNASISADGSAVVFESQATNLVAGFVDLNGAAVADVFVWSRADGSIALASHASAGTATSGSALSQRARISDDGAYVVFESAATNLVAGFADGNGTGTDLFLYRRATGSVTLVTHANGSLTTSANGGTVGTADISGDGRWVSFVTGASNVVPGDGNAADDAFLHDGTTGVNVLLSHVPGAPGTPGNGAAGPPSLSADGSRACFSTAATNLGFTDGNSRPDLVLRDRASGTFTLVTHLPGSQLTTANDTSYGCTLSRNGRWALYDSYATSLVSGFVDSNGAGTTDLYLFEAATGENRLVSHSSSSGTTGANRAVGLFRRTLSDEGDQVAFDSEATNLVAGFVNANGTTGSATDVFLYRRNSGAIELASHRPGSAVTGGSLQTLEATVAPSGDRVVFYGAASDLVADDGNLTSDAFLYSSVCSADGLSATPAGNNAIALAWTAGTPPFEVKRALAPGGPYQVVGTPSSTSFTDTTAQGGVTYYYLVANGCGDSNEVAASTSGACQLAPTFAGAASATQSGATTCTVQVSWPAASAPCGGSLSYAVYRGGAPGFTPDVTTRLAANLPGLSYTDTAGVASGVPLYYVVRATDGGNGEEDQNLVERSVLPTSCTASAPPPVGVLTVRAGDQQSRIEWINPAGFANARLGYRSDGVYPTDPGDPLATFLDYVVTPGAASRDDVGHATNGTFRWRAFVDAGGSLYSGPLSTQGRTFDTSGNVKWAYSTNATALATAGVLPGTSYYVVSNDRFLHGLAAGAAGGSWPQGPPEWKPFAMNAPAQSRPTAVRLPATTVAGESSLALVGSQDGRVYALSARTGDLLWASPVLGAAVQGGVSAIFRDFGAAHDLVVVGTREPTGDSRLVGLRLADGGIAWSFDNGGGASGIGVINGQPSVDQAANRAYFASRRRGGGSSDTVWCLSFTGTSVAKVWSVDVGDVDASLVVRNGAVYVGNTTGQVYALDPVDGSVLWGPLPTGDGPVKGLLWPEAGTGRLFFSTTGQVHGWAADGSPWWPGPISLANPSPVLVVGGRVYVGSSSGNGSLWAIDTSSAATATSVPLGDPLVPKVVGAPTRDSVNNSIVVGTDAGQVYDVALPLP